CDAPSAGSLCLRKGLTGPWWARHEGEGQRMESLEMEAVLQRRRPPTQRWLTGLLAAALVLVTVGGLIQVTVTNVPASLGELLHDTPTPTPTIAPGGNVVFYVPSARWGKWTVDGKLALIPASLSESFLDRGRHTLQYHADPSPPLRCTISTPAAASDTCPLDTAFTDAHSLPLGARRVVDLGATLDRLPEEQQASLMAAVKRAIEYASPVTMVRTGERYSGVHGDGITLELATQPLRARILIRMWAPSAGKPTSTGDPLADCPSLCLAPPFST